MAKNKFYVVWRGRRCGIFDNWDDCKAQIDKFEGAVYKGFATYSQAEEAFDGGVPNSRADGVSRGMDRQRQRNISQ